MPTCCCSHTMEIAIINQCNSASLLSSKGGEFWLKKGGILLFLHGYSLAEMIFILPTNLVGEITFHLPNWNFYLPNFFLNFNKNLCVFVNYLLLAFLIFFFKTSTLTVKKLIKWLNFFPTKFSIMINHKSLTREYYWVTKSFFQNFELY